MGAAKLRERAPKFLKYLAPVNLCGIIPLTQVTESGTQMSRDRPDEIEVTPAMIEAGRAVFGALWLEFISDRGEELWPELLTAAYLAMMATWRGSIHG
jgi:hypothetical protein